MLTFISKFLGKGNSKTAIPENVDENWVKRVHHLLARLEDAGKSSREGWASDIVSFILHGEPLSVLNEVAQNPKVASRLKRSHVDPKESDLYVGFSDLPDEIALRWAYFLEACGRATQNATFFFQSPHSIAWAEMLLLHASGHYADYWPKPTPKFNGLTMEKIERLLTATGEPAAALLTSAFATPVSSTYGAITRLQTVAYLEDFSQAVARHAESICPHLLPAAHDQKLHVLAMLERLPEAILIRFASELAEMGVSTSKQVRSAAEPLIGKCGTPVTVHLKETALRGKPEQRVQALRLLKSLAGKLKDDGLGTFAEETACADKAASVQALIGEWTAAVSIESQADNFQYTLPTIDWKPADASAVSRLMGRYRQKVAAGIAADNKKQQDHYDHMAASGRKSQLKLIPDIPDATFQALEDFIVSGGLKPPASGLKERQQIWRAAQTVREVASDPEMTPVILTKMLWFFDDLASQGYMSGSLSANAVDCYNALHAAGSRPTLLELQQLLGPAGLPPETLLNSFCSSWRCLASDWAGDAVWPFFADNQELLVRTLTTSQADNYWFERSGILRGIATVPVPPVRVVNTLFSLALGSGKTDRPHAQNALSNHPGKETRIIDALRDGKADTRAVAARWLAELRHLPALPALEQAVLKEKNDGAKGALLDALQLLGQPVEKYLDRGALADEATRSLAKGLPKDLDWFPWSSVPPVRWADTSESVPAPVIRWMIAQGCKQKTPEPNAVLRKYCGMFHPADREELGQFVLEAWVHQDVLPVSRDEAMKRAADQALSIHTMMRQYPQYYQDTPFLNYTVEQLKAHYLPSFLRQPAGSAIGSKGVLAVAAACAGQRAAAPVARYLKEYYGTRAAQGKALIAMLAWIEHPSATQLMLSVGSRFRTKSFQEEATRQAEALAERKGWTLAELADRTIPTAGFDESRNLELSYGERRFTAKLMPEFKIELFNSEGKKIAALPEPRATDDPELAKDAKKALSAAKKELKSIVTLQTERFYEALCTEREWSFEDWDAYLNRHPVVHSLVQRLVWVQFEEGRVAQSFRPLDDGSLTDCDDNDISVPGHARVRVAHDSLLAQDQVARWQQHLVDYEIAPLFQQLGKGVYRLPQEKSKADSIDDFKGHLIQSFALRGRALKLGYTRGAPGDGGWFMEYEKRFPTLGLVAVLEFTGSPLPEENRTVALLTLTFAKAGGDAWQRAALPLSKVPAILLSECYNDMRLIAADGSGFDPEWEKKSEY